MTKNSHYFHKNFTGLKFNCTKSESGLKKLAYIVDLKARSDLILTSNLVYIYIYIYILENFNSAFVSSEGNIFLIFFSHSLFYNEFLINTCFEKKNYRHRHFIEKLYTHEKKKENGSELEAN